MFPSILNGSGPLRSSAVRKISSACSAWRIVAAPVLSMCCACFPGPASTSPAKAASKAASGRTAAGYAKIPLSFETNQGQSDGQVKFLSRGDGYQLFLTSTSAVFQLRTPAGTKSAPAVFRMELLDANRNARISGADQLPGVANYFIGNDPKKWRSGISEVRGHLYWRGCGLLRKPAPVGV